MIVRHHGISRRGLMNGVAVLGLLAAVRRVPGQSNDSTSWSKLTFAQVSRIVSGLQRAGQKMPQGEVERVQKLLGEQSDENAAELSRVLDGYTLLRVELDKYGVGQSQPGPAVPQLIELGWRTFVVRIENPARLTGPLLLVSRSAIAEGEVVAGIHEGHILGSDVAATVHLSPDADFDYERDATQWMGFRFGLAEQAYRGLEGAPVEYQLLQIYSQLGGSNTASVAACSGSVPVARRAASRGFTQTFTCTPASTVTLQIRDSDGRGAMASLLIRDEASRVYPAPAHRIEPDLGYQWNIYRANGETLRLPAGRYQVTVARGPEYVRSEQEIVVPEGGRPLAVSIQLTRWINATAYGWYPGEPHAHPEGQIYGAVSKLGLVPETLLRQVRGEALSLASVLIWTYGYYYEKQFLTGHVYDPAYTLPFPERQSANNVSWTPTSTPHDRDSLVRYDVEQAAFPSNRFGHPILLRVSSHQFPGAKGVYDWPSWNLPILEWARAQGAVTGYAHCGNSMAVNTPELPNHEIPPMDGLGANECLVDVTHGMLDFMAGGESQPAADLNVWYHLLNCGFNIPMIGETDFPVGSGTRIIGSVRTYVRLETPPLGDDGYSRWVEGVKSGRLYFGDGRSHLLDFQVNDHPLGGAAVELAAPGRVVVAVKVGAFLDETPRDPDIDPWGQGYAYWHIERARIGSSRKVPVEVVVNGRAVARREILADGRVYPVSMTVPILRSSWVTVRILPSAHAAAFTVRVGGLPVRASRRSAQWCLDCIDLFWKKHANRIRKTELAAAEAAWEHARNTYRSIARECATD